MRNSVRNHCAAHIFPGAAERGCNHYRSRHTTDAIRRLPIAFHLISLPLSTFSVARQYASHAAKSSSFPGGAPTSAAAKTSCRAAPPQVLRRRVICRATAEIRKFPCTLANASDFSHREGGAVCMRSTDAKDSVEAPPVRTLVSASPGTASHLGYQYRCAVPMRTFDSARGEVNRTAPSTHPSFDPFF